MKNYFLDHKITLKMSFLYIVPSLIHHAIFNSASAALGGCLLTFIEKLSGGRHMEEDFNLDPLTVKSLSSFTKRKFESFPPLFILWVLTHPIYLSIFYNASVLSLIVSLGDLAFMGEKQILNMFIEHLPCARHCFK